jgi:hypothetical protein
MKIGIAQKQNIAIQHRYFRTHRGYTRAKNPVSFEKWFLFGVRRMEKKGADFTFLAPGLVRIQWPGKPVILRTVSDLEREYFSEYLSKF